DIGSSRKPRRRSRRSGTGSAGRDHDRGGRAPPRGARGSLGPPTPREGRKPPAPPPGSPRPPPPLPSPPPTTPPPSPPTTPRPRRRRVAASAGSTSRAVPELPPGLAARRPPRLIQEVQLAARVHRRRTVRPRQPFLPDRLAGRGVEAVGGSFLRHHVEMRFHV